MSDQTEAAPVETPYVNPQFSLDILPYIKTSQNQNGLRRAEYGRYRLFCAKRLRRIRKGVKFLHGKAKFVPKLLEVKDVKDKRYIEMLVVQAERAWAGAMECKEDRDNSRAKYHCWRRLAKSVSWAKKLVTITESCADARTQLEAQAYLAWMTANELFEREEWEQVKSSLMQAKTVYEKLGHAVTPEQSEYYTIRVDELTTLYRYALSKSDAKSSLADAESLRAMMTLAADDPALKLLQTKLDSVIDATQRKRAEQTSEITWLGQKIVLTSAALKLAFVKASETTAEVEAVVAAEKQKKKKSDTTAGESGSEGTPATTSTTVSSKKGESLGHKLAAYDRLFQVWSETKLKIRDERALVLQQAKNEAKLKDLELLMDYATFTEQTQMVVRNLLLVASIEKKIDSVGFDNLASVKPDEVVRMYESTLQLLAASDQLRNAALEGKTPDVAATKAAKALSEGQEFAFKAIRCYYLSLSYMQVGKFGEAAALLARSKDYSNLVPRLLDGKDPKVAKRIARLLLQIRSALIWGQAKSMLVSQPPSQSEVEEVVSAPNATILSNLKSWDASYARTQIIDFPPTTQAIPSKPVLFDLAFSGFEAPDLTAKAKAPKSGFFSSFWRS